MRQLHRTRNASLVHGDCGEIIVLLAWNDRTEQQTKLVADLTPVSVWPD